MHRTCHIVIIVAAVWLVFVMPSVRAASEQDAHILQALRTADNQMRTGVIQYTVVHKVVWLGTPAPRDMTAHNDRREVTMTYLPNKEFKQEIRRWAQGKVDSWSYMYDGHDASLTIVAAKTGLLTTNIMPGKPSQLQSYGPLIDFAPGPCFPLGRGLSTLQNLRVTSSGKTVTVAGTASDNTKISAVLDPAHQYVAQTIRRTDATGGAMWGWSFGAPVPTKHGPFVASSADYGGAIAGSKGTDIQKYTLISANFTELNIQGFNTTIPPGSTVLDGRLGRYVAINNNSSAPLSKDSLLVLTRRQLALVAQQHLEGQMYEQGQSRRRMALIAVPVSLALTFIAIGGFVLRKRRYAGR